jgi:Arc/MetJ family transcription regulator
LRCTHQSGRLRGLYTALRMCKDCINHTHRVEAAVRTNIEIDDKLMARALKATGLSSKRAVVEEGLRLLVKLRGQAKVRESFGKYPMHNDLEESRQGRKF